MQLSTALLALLGTPLVSAHMEMLFPPPLKSKFNPAAKASGNIDSDMTSPLAGSGSNYPCKGYQSLLGTPEGASVVTFAPGSKYNFTITGGAFHGGGSCQASLSYDKGATFTVIQSIHGECPTASGGSFDFTVPADAPAGKDVLFAWTWFNEIGNREMYMNCASVTIGGGSSKREVEVEKRATAFSSRPGVFKANLGDGCGTEPGKDVIFPNPGPDVVNNGDKLAKPTGTCEAATGGDAGGSPAASSPVASSAAATPTTAPAAAPATTSTKAPAVTATLGSGSATTRYVPTDSVTTHPTFPYNGPSMSSQLSPSPSATYTSPPFPMNTTTIPMNGTGTGNSHSSSTTLPGGVFITISSSTAATPTASTLASSVKPTTSSTPATSIKPTTTAAAASPTGTGTSSPGTGSGSFAAGTPCTNEGAWNCVGGTSFQRCASGAWSVQMAMAAGTKCQVGLGDTLVYARRKGRVVRMAGAEAKAWV